MSWIEVLSKRGTMKLLAELAFKPMRYVDLKNKTELPDSTLARRLTELIKCGLIIQRPQRTPSGRYRLTYEIAEEVHQITQTGFELARREIAIERSLEKLEESYIRALRSLPLSERQKGLAEEELIRKFQDIEELIKELINFKYTKAYLEAVALARASSPL